MTLYFPPLLSRDVEVSWAHYHSFFKIKTNFVFLLNVSQMYKNLMMQKLVFPRENVGTKWILKMVYTPIPHESKKFATPKRSFLEWTIHHLFLKSINVANAWGHIKYNGQSK